MGWPVFCCPEGAGMEWRTVRLKAHDWRGLTGDLVEVPVTVARELMAEKRAEVVRADSVQVATTATATRGDAPCSVG